MKLTKTLDLLARPRGFEPLTLGLEMRGFVVKSVKGRSVTRCPRSYDRIAYEIISDAIIAKLN